MIKNNSPVRGARVLMLGITFKENCPDIRNSHAIDIYHELTSYGIEVEVYDRGQNPLKYNTNMA
jgi:UDP-N-acetyl-D-galactosamine dehydrogenase